MSFTKLSYDTCAYKNELAQSVGTLGWVIDPSRFENFSKSRIEFGIVAGNDVSIIGKNQMVDLESDLKGQTRLASRCPTLYYQNPCPNSDMNTCKPDNFVIRSNPSNAGRVIDTTLYHLAPAQMFRYTPIPVDPYMGKSVNK